MLRIPTAGMGLPAFGWMTARHLQCWPLAPCSISRTHTFFIIVAFLPNPLNPPLSKWKRD
jgi:hypothetical protein